LLLFGCLLGGGCHTAANRAPLERKGGGGEFRVLLVGEPATLNPNLGQDEAALIVGANLYNQLVTLDVDLRLLPDLASHWDVSSDGRIYTFHLRPGVRWHDGRPLSSRDVKWTFARLQSEGWIGRDVAARIARIETPDPLTVAIHLREIWAPFLHTIAAYGTFIMPEHAGGADLRTSQLNERPIGTGPFKFDEWVKGKRVVLEANTDYFGRGPFLDRVTYMVEPDPVRLGQALLAGEADYAVGRPAQQLVSSLKQVSHLTVSAAHAPRRSGAARRDWPARRGVRCHGRRSRREGRAAATAR
jgi:peptide/nickel transport system substrate-binding protein